MRRRTHRTQIVTRNSVQAWWSSAARVPGAPGRSGSPVVLDIVRPRGLVARSNYRDDDGVNRSSSPRDVAPRRRGMTSARSSGGGTTPSGCDELDSPARPAVCPCRRGDRLRDAFRSLSSCFSSVFAEGRRAQSPQAAAARLGSSDDTRFQWRRRPWPGRADLAGQRCAERLSTRPRSGTSGAEVQTLTDPWNLLDAWLRAGGGGCDRAGWAAGLSSFSTCVVWLGCAAGWMGQAVCVVRSRGRYRVPERGPLFGPGPVGLVGASVGRRWGRAIRAGR